MTEHKNLPEALAAVQGALETLPKNGHNPAFGGTKFTPLDTIVEHVGKLLSEHGLAFSAWPTYGPDGKPALRYKLAHVSGEFDQDTMPLLNAKQDPQGMGGGITYARRYALSAVLNIVSDDDDDGNAGSRRPPPQPQLASAKQVEEMIAAADGLDSELVLAALDDCGIDATGYKTIPADKVAPFITAVRQRSAS